MSSLPQPNFLNLEYFFGLIYRLIFGGSGDILTSTNGVNLFQLPLWFQIVSTLISMLMITGIIFFLTKLLNIRKEENDSIYGSSAEAGLPIVHKKNPRWERIMDLVNTETSSEWKVAVIEADKLLEEMINYLPIQGENLGDKMKKIDRSDFLTLDDAWEAHKVRNRIAHEPGFEISQHEARRVIGLFKKVFDEFDFI